jgi:hypothetical protein
MRISNRKVFAQDLNVIYRLLQIVVNMLLDCQDSLALVGKFEFLRQYIHPQMLIIIWERQEFELEIYLVLRIPTSSIICVGLGGICRG